jgi:hypothetical protein
MEALAPDTWLLTKPHFFIAVELDKASILVN